MSGRLHLAHQFDAAMHDWLRIRLPASARIERLPADDPWAVPEGTTVLLVANGKLRSLARTAPAWARELAWVHTRPTGVDEAPDWLFDVPHFTVSRGAASVAIAEYVMAAILDLEKRLNAIRVKGRDDWSDCDIGSLSGRSLGLVGFGEIGKAVALRAAAFDMKIRAVHRSSRAVAWDVEFRSFEELCAQSDHLVLCVPLTRETRGIFDADAFAKCQPGQHLINVARGALIVSDALRAALDGPIARATLDVWVEEPPPDGHWIYRHPSVVLTPHCSSRGPSTEARMQEILEANLAAWMAGRPDELFGRVSRAAGY